MQNGGFTDGHCNKKLGDFLKAAHKIKKKKNEDYMGDYTTLTAGKVSAESNVILIIFLCFFCTLRPWENHPPTVGNISHAPNDALLS